MRSVMRLKMGDCLRLPFVAPLIIFWFVTRAGAIFARLPVLTFAAAYVFAHGVSMRDATLLCAASFGSLLVWPVSVMAGYEVSRKRHLTNLVAFLTARGGRYHTARNLSAELIEAFSSEFHRKRVSQRAAQKLFGEDVSSVEFVVLVPNSNARTEKLRPPTAFPNYKDESIVIYPLDRELATIPPFQRFLLYHEIEHCTPDAFKVEGHHLVGPARACTFGLLLLCTVQSVPLALAAAMIVIVILLLDFLLWQPAQIEYRTDCRAISKVPHDNLSEVFKELASFCERHNTPHRRWLSPYFSEWEMRVFAVRSILDAHRLFGMNAEALKIVGNMSMFEAAYVIPLIGICGLPLFSAVSLSVWMLAPFAVALAVLYVVQGVAAYEGDKLLSDARLKRPK